MKEKDVSVRGKSATGCPWQKQAEYLKQIACQNASWKIQPLMYIEDHITVAFLYNVWIGVDMVHFHQTCRSFLYNEREQLR